MAQNDFIKLFDPALTQTLTGFNSFPFDMSVFMESQRKNFHALTQAQQQAIEGLQAVTQRQGEILSQIIEDQSILAREMMSEGPPEQKVAKQAELLKKNYEKSIGNLREISELLSKSGQQASDIINKRITASLNEIKIALEKSQKTATKKAA